MRLACRTCNGTGFEPDHQQIGREMRARRMVAGLSLRAVAQEMGVSAAYLSDLELGHRAWNSKITQAFCRVVPE